MELRDDDLRLIREKGVNFAISVRAILQAFEDACAAADALLESVEFARLAVEVSPPCDVEPQDAPHPTFANPILFDDVTHSVFVEGEPIYSGSQGECQAFADNHMGGGGYGIAPIKS